MDPKITKAAILFKQDEPLIVDDITMPENLLAGQVLVELLTSGICGSQLGEISGVKGDDPYLPHLMGHEGCGNVLDIGPGVKNVQIGDRVVLHWRKGNGIQSETPIYKWRGSTLNAGWVTTFNKHAVISENRCTKISKDIDPCEAALFGCAVTTGFGVIENNAKIKIGESVLIFGSGGIGLNMIQACKMRSAYPIIAVDLYQGRLDLAKSIGATHTINSLANDPKEAIKEILNNEKLDFFIDNTGLPKSIELGYEITKNDGKIILVGVPKKGDNVNIFTLPLHFGKVLTGSHGGDTNPSQDIPRYSDLLLKGKLSLKQLITNKFDLEHINMAIDSMRFGETSGRIIINL